MGTTCSAGVETRCAADGSRSTRPCDFGCTAGGDRCLRPVPSNLASSFVSASAAELTLSGMYDTTVCAGGMVVSQGGGPDVCVISASRVSVPSSLTVTGAHPLVIVASGAVVIDASIDLSARGTAAGPGGYRGGTRAAPDGTGPSPGLRASASGSNADGGGGAGGLCGAGGRGGTGQSITGGAGGAAITGWALSPLEGGSGGAWARGASGTMDTSADGGAGAARCRSSRRSPSP
ncbi:MAG: hypothetical protein M5U28_20570 [Sandaracinaceae bacterium]|nr:hypothetical protein [Sandaracinaceae bacterium]